MKNKFVFILPLVTLVSACSTVTVPNSETKEYVYPVNSPYDREMLPNQGQKEDDGNDETKPLPTFVKTAEVPQKQVSAKNIDVGWVQQQSPSGLTILVASDTQPLPVGMALTQTPKDQRCAALKYERNGQLHYSGVYGSYNDKESAQQALQKLPEDLKGKARIVNWSDMQQLNLQ